MFLKQFVQNKFLQKYLLEDVIIKEMKCEQCKKIFKN